MGTNQIGTNGNFYKNFRIPAKKWVKIELKQYPENEKTIFEMIIDGKSEKIVNTKPTSYQNVKVWAAQGKYYPTANVNVQNLLFDQRDYVKVFSHNTLGGLFSN